MEYNEKIAKIGGLSEKELRQDVLIPLLNSMGDKGMKEYHGTGERGKDIVCYSLNNLGDREYTAVVVKTGKIHGSVGKEGSIAHIVSVQVKQALNEPYVDVYGLKKITADRCLVVTSDKIVPNCVESIFGTIESEQLQRALKIFDGNWLVQKIDEHMPTYFEEKDENEIIQEKEKQISELKEKRTRAVEVIYDIGREYGTPEYVTDSSATAVFSSSSELDFSATVFSGTTATFDPYIPRSQILKRFIDEGIISNHIICSHCGTENWIDTTIPFLICTNCGNSIY